MERIRFRILGVDPGFRDGGIARVVYETTGRGRGVTTLEGVRLVSTQKRKRSVREKVQKKDDIRRLDEIVDAFAEEAKAFQPTIVAFEAMPFVRNARATAQIALAWAACYALARRLFNVPVLVYDPKAVKQAVGVDDEGEKEEVFRAVAAMFPKFRGWPRDASERFLAHNDPRSHVADAVAAGIAARDSPQVHLAVEQWKRRTRVAW